MSVEMIGRVRGIKVAPATAKFLLWVLADRADADGRCWPGVMLLANECCLTDRQVRRLLSVLQEQGLIEIEKHAGRASIYTLTPDAHVQGTPDAHVQGTPDAHVQGTPDAHVRGGGRDPGHPRPTPRTPMSGHPGRPCQDHYVEPSLNHQEPSVGEAQLDLVVGSTTSPTAPAPSTVAKKASRLPDDWRPTKAGIAYATGRGFSRQQTDDMAESFCEHWQNKTGAKALKLNWDRAWQTWVRNQEAWGVPRSPNGRASSGRPPPEGFSTWELPEI